MTLCDNQMFIIFYSFLGTPLHKVIRHSFSLIMSQILTSKNYHTTTLTLDYCILILDEPRIILQQHSSSRFYLNNPTSRKCFNIWSQVVCSRAYTIIFILKNYTQEQKYCSFEISRKLRQCLEVDLILERHKLMNKWDSVKVAGNHKIQSAQILPFWADPNLLWRNFNNEIEFFFTKFGP